MKYTQEQAEKIYKEVFGVKANLKGHSALGSYRHMRQNVEINYNNSEEISNKINELIMPFFEDIKENPNKIL